MPEQIKLKANTKPCQCGKRMILRTTDQILLSYPGRMKEEWWCGGCGQTEQIGGAVTGITKESMDMLTWKAANQSN